MNIKKISAIGGGVSLIAGSIFGILEAKKNADYKSKIKTYILYRNDYIEKAKVSSDVNIRSAICGSIDWNGCNEHAYYLPKPHENEMWKAILITNIKNNYRDTAYYKNEEELKEFCYKSMNIEANNNFDNTSIVGDGYFQSCIISKSWIENNKNK